MQEQALQPRHHKSHKKGRQEEVHSRHHKSSHKNKGKPTATTRDSKASSSKTASVSNDNSSLSSTLLELFPPRAPSTSTTSAGKSIDKRRAKAALFSHDDTSHDIESLATLETLDVKTISPGVVHITGPNSDDIHETRHPYNILDETENVNDLCELVVAAQVVPDDEEREVEIKKRLVREIKEEVEMRLMTEGRPPVVAEAMRAKAPWRTRGCVLLVAILIIMVTVIAIVVPSKPHDDNNDINDTQTESMNTSPPSIVVCAGATPIQEGQTSISSWINPPTKGLDELNYSSSCDYGSLDDIGYSPGPNTMWFSLVGTGDVYEVSTGSSDLYFNCSISVGIGSFCDYLQCIAYTSYFYDSELTQSLYGAATIRFHTDVGIPYYIGVESFASRASDLNFTLSINTVVDVPLNVDCANSIVIKPGESFVPGTITNATYDMHFNYPCQETLHMPSVWYSLVGTGDVFEISTCTSDLNFDSGISISTGSCDNLECLASVPFNAFDCMGTPYGGATVNFYSEVGVNYFLQVNPVTINWDGSSAQPAWDGNFTLVVSSGQGPANDNCSSAAVVEANTSPVLGSMSHASWEVTCGVEDWGSKIVWYILIGTGDVYKISTCSSVLNFDSSFSVMTGSCDNLYCMIHAEVIQHDCPEVSYKAGTFVLVTEIGVAYYIAVDATNYTWSEDFSLHVATFEPPLNDECSGATEIQANNETVYGTTMNATYSADVNAAFNPFLFGTYDGPDLWYSIKGNGTYLVASFYSNATGYWPGIEIFEGNSDSCDHIWIASTDWGNQVQWFATFGVTYYIRVSGCCDTRGPFGLRLTFI